MSWRLPTTIAHRLALALAAGGCCRHAASGAAEPPSSTAGAMRLLKTNCFSCHNEEKKKSGLVMTSREALLKGGDNGEAIVAGSPEKSALIAALDADADPHMPPKKQLGDADINTLRRWIADGAPWDAAALKAQPSAPRTVALLPLPLAYHPVLALALSPDGTRLAGGWGNQVVLFDAAAKDPVLLDRASAHPDPVQSVAWSADGKHLATGAFRRVVLWNPETLAPEREVTAGLTDRITALRFLPDGKRLVIADGRVTEEGTVRIIDVETGAIQSSWLAHGDTIFDLALSADGKTLATAGGDKLIKIWDLDSHAEIARLEGHVAQVLSIAFNADATQLVTAGADQQLKAWDVKTKERISSLGTHNVAVNAVAWVEGGASGFRRDGSRRSLPLLRNQAGLRRPESRIRAGKKTRSRGHRALLPGRHDQGRPHLRRLLRWSHLHLE